MQIRIFLDTEFTDFVDPELISIALTTDSIGGFYAETLFTLSKCSDFVRANVLPLLSSDAKARLTSAELGRRLEAWLTETKADFHDIEICFDSDADWMLFRKALGCAVPEWCHPRSIVAHVDEKRRQEFYTANHLPEHHALYDARASCYAFTEEAQSTSAEDFRF